MFKKQDTTLGNGEHWKIQVLDCESRTLLDRVLTKSSLSVSGIEDNGDEFLAPLGKQTIYIDSSKDGALLEVESAGPSIGQSIGQSIGLPNPKKSKTIGLIPGQIKKIGDLFWLLTSVTAEQSIDASDNLSGVALSSQPSGDFHSEDLFLRLSNWVGTPMNDKHSLRSGFEGFLEILTQYTPAVNGLLVMFDEEGMQLVASNSLTPENADRLLQNIPATITQEILKTGSRLILPDDIGKNFDNKSTIFIRNIQSVAGFPVMAEKKVIAILLLGFDNLIAEMSEKLQSMLENTTNIIGMVIQRSLLREQISSRSNLDKNEGTDFPHQKLSRLMVGNSKTMDVVYHSLRKLAPVKVSVLITGETGTGKELAAQEIHRLSPRNSKPFIAINAAALPENLIESELFGHKRGAFTGALSDRKGLIEQANGGTLFIDEIGELPLALQAKLLRVLQEKVVQRIGDHTLISVDFRLVTATHCKLNEMLTNKSFRDDLYYRIAGATITLPPLRDRSEDILLLANFFKKQTSQFHNIPEKDWSRGAIDTLLSHRWSGNIRELQNTVERACIMSEGSVVNTSDLGLISSKSKRAGASSLEEGPLEALPLADAKDAWLRTHLVRALEKNDWNKKNTAKSLDIGLRTLFRHIDQLGIQGGRD